MQFLGCEFGDLKYRDPTKLAIKGGFLRVWN
jgi:hypothetical protein